jgi:hypothetical protein
MTWTDTNHCHSRVHCARCRRDASWRAVKAAQYGGPWSCPLDASLAGVAPSGSGAAAAVVGGASRLGMPDLRQDDEWAALKDAIRTSGSAALYDRLLRHLRAYETQPSPFSRCEIRAARERLWMLWRDFITSNQAVQEAIPGNPSA